MAQNDLVDYLAMTLEKGASDLHITPNSAPTMRIYGSLQPLTEQILSATECRELVYSVLKDSQRSRFEHEWDLDFALNIESIGRFRGNVSYVLGKVSANFRYIPDTIPELALLGHSDTVNKWCEAKSGLILVTGSSGSGKSHTLASMTQTIARQRCANIISIEDPVEFVFKQGHSLVHQREIGTDAKDFHQALRSALRQDADVILLGEMRDEETIRTAMTAADTGHLVIGTLHTTDTSSAVSRILDAFPPERQNFVCSQLASSLRGVVCQYLLPRKDKPGLALASELLVVNTGVASCIRDRRVSQIPSLIQIGSGDGMHTLEESLLTLLIDQRIKLEDALAHSANKESLENQYTLAMKQKTKKWFG